MKRLLSVAVAIALAGCSTTKQTEPPLSGPSELALSLAVSASPDQLTQDGQAASLVTVVARGPSGQPIRGVTMRLAMYVGALNVDYGTLASKTISTDNNGIASTIYTAPMPAPLTDTDQKTVDILVVPSGSDYSSDEPRRVSIHLVRPGLILPPNPTVKASFFVTPTSPSEDAPIIFDGSGSTGSGLTYTWTFGDGASGSGMRVTHSYSVAGTYSTVLTVTDDRGTADSSSLSVIVSAAADPTAEFISSPATPVAGADVFFDGSLSTTPTGSGRTIVSYDWNFGDGNAGSGQKVSHSYQTPGAYEVVLNVRDSTGRRGTAHHSVTVK